MTLEILAIMISVYFFIIILAILLIKDITVKEFVKALTTNDLNIEEKSEELTIPNWSLDDFKKQLEDAATFKKEPGPDDSTFEFLINEFCTDNGVSIYYANYTRSNVEVRGERIDDWAIRIITQSSESGEIKTLEELDEEYDSNTRFVFRITLKGKNYLVWGLSREDAYIKLYGFIHWFKNLY